MTRDEIVDFLEWAKECGQLQFPESRKVDMAEMYIKEQDVVNKTCNIPHVVGRSELFKCPTCCDTKVKDNGDYCADCEEPIEGI